MRYQPVFREQYVCGASVVGGMLSEECEPKPTG